MNKIWLQKWKASSAVGTSELIRNRQSLLRKIQNIVLLLLFCTQILQAQEKPKPYALDGYLSLMQQNLIFDQPLSGKKGLITDNLLHNRINFKYFLNEKWTFRADLRSRLLWGEFTKLNTQSPAFAKALNTSSNDAITLSAVLSEKEGVIAHSVLDRLFMEYAGEKWEVRLGRQRINWGINTIWNPNDIFNTASFFDFDYVEQPGSDALRVSRYIGLSDKMEFAISPNKDFDRWTAALLWKTHYKTYDLQFLSGWMEEEVVLGAGWAGSIKNLGFKGEISTFLNNKENLDNSLSATTSLDYSFKKGLYASWGLLYNSNGQTNAPFRQVFNFQVSPKNLYPYQWATVTQFSFPFNPLLNGSLAIIYSPVKANPLFINPNISYNLSDNFDLSLISQIVFSNDDQDQYHNFLDGVFLRMKYSY